MFRKTILSTVAIASLTLATGTTVMAGNYGYSNGYNTGYKAGYAQKHGIAIGVWKRHVNWCANRYNSYRAWDNSWLPYINSHRKQCWSPYYNG